MTTSVRGAPALSAPAIGAPGPSAPAGASGPAGITQMAIVCHRRRFELYKTTAKFDADVGRKQHGFPLLAEMGG